MFNHAHKNSTNANIKAQAKNPSIQRQQNLVGIIAIFFLANATKMDLAPNPSRILQLADYRSPRHKSWHTFPRQTARNEAPPFSELSVDSVPSKWLASTFLTFLFLPRAGLLSRRMQS